MKQYVIKQRQVYNIALLNDLYLAKYAIQNSTAPKDMNCLGSFTLDFNRMKGPNISKKYIGNVAATKIFTLHLDLDTMHIVIESRIIMNIATLT